MDQGFLCQSKELVGSGMEKTISKTKQSMWFLNSLKILYTLYIPCSFFNTYFNNHRIVQAALTVGFSRAATLCSKAHCGQSNQ